MTVRLYHVSDRPSIGRFDPRPSPSPRPGVDEPIDLGAAYYVSREAVLSLAVTPVDDILAALLERDVELRVMPPLWKLRDAVVASTLQFSMIRTRNARPRDSEGDIKR